MECNKDEALRAKALAEKKMLEKDFVGARKMINKAQKLCAEVDNISQMLTVCDVHCAAGMKVNGEIDWYGVLQVPPLTANDAQIKRQYRKLALLLHPDKNKFAGAEAAFKLVGEANMTLTDHSKRSVYDMKRKASVRVGATRAPTYQPSGRTAHTTPVNLHNNAGSQTFWTICQTCGMRYQYYISMLKRAIRCQSCLKPFIAHDLSEQTVPSGANQQPAGVYKNTGAPQNFPGPQTNVTGQQAWNYATPGVPANSGSHNADVNTKGRVGNKSRATGLPKDKTKFARTSKSSSTAGLKRSRRSVVESSESSESETSTDSEEEVTGDGTAANTAGPSQHSRRSSRQKQEVKYKEESEDEDVDDDVNYDDDDIVNSSNFKRLRKGGLCSDDQSNKTKLNDDTTGRNGSVNGVNHEKEKIFNSVSNNGLGPKSDDASNEDKFNCVDSEFFNFDQLRDVNQFRANQIWAVYDSQGCMPRFYARITKVKTTPKFMVQFVWLEFDPANKAEMEWSYGGLPVACGHFKHGKSETAKESNMFSQIISCQKSKISNSYEIYPRKGEVWALFKGWDIGWSSNARNHTDYEYEVVQVVSDFTTGTSIIVMPLVKIKGFVSLFLQSKEATPHLVPQDDTLRFSHCIPHHLMSGTEREGIPEGALELDPAALPLNMEEAFASLIPESSSARGQEFGARYAGSSSGINSCKGSVGVGERQHDTCMNAGNFTNKLNEENSEHITPSAVGSTDDEEFDDIVQAEIECPEPEFYEFSVIRSLQQFEPGKIWALYSDVDKFPNYYAFVKNVDFKNNKVQVRWLDVCPQGEEEKRLVNEDRTVGCGTFKVSSVHGITTYTGTESFSHPVRTRSTGRRNEYEIIPHLHEIWAVYKNWRAGWTAEDFKKCGYELVEILGHTDSSIQVQHLRKVDGYRAVFRRDDSVQAISKDEYPKFSHQIPCFHLTNECRGKLRGFMELDPYSVPEEFLFTDSM